MLLLRGRRIIFPSKEHHLTSAKWKHLGRPSLEAIGHRIYELRNYLFDSLPTSAQHIVTAVVGLPVQAEGVSIVIRNLSVGTCGNSAQADSSHDGIGIFRKDPRNVGIIFATVEHPCNVALELNRQIGFAFSRSRGRSRWVS